MNKNIYQSNKLALNTLRTSPSYSRYYVALLSILQSLPHQQNREVPEELRTRKDKLNKFKKLSKEKTYDTGRVIKYLMDKQGIKENEMFCKMKENLSYVTFKNEDFQEILKVNGHHEMQRKCFEILGITEDDAYEIAKQKKYYTTLAYQMIVFQCNQNIDIEALMDNLSEENAALFNNILIAFEKMDLMEN